MNKKTVVLSLFFLFIISSIQAADKTPKELFNQAFSFESEENWYEASQFYLEVVNENPAYSEAWFRLANCCYRLGEYDLAFQYLENAERYEKSNASIQNMKGMILLALGRIEDARQIFYEVLKKYPNDIDAHFGLAEIELYDGKYSGAELQYSEALKRQASNRKALLSIALICAEQKRYSQAEKYLRQAMQYYSGEPEVHYLAAIIYNMKGDYINAEKHERIAVEIKGDYEKAYELLANTLYCQKRYSEVIDLCDYLILKNRNNSSAWYLKGIAQEKLGNTVEAIQTWNSGLKVSPQDELMRMMLELNVRKTLSLDDARRADWAAYHIDIAKQYEGRFDKAGSTYEYQRALILDPSNKEARLAYANILELNGMHELYLSQLSFIKNNSDGTIPSSLSDTIEAYSSLLQNTLAKKWKVEPFYLDKTRWNIAVFYTEEASLLNHAEVNRLSAMAAGDIFSGVAITAVKTQVTPVSGYGEAFKNARANGFDYFVIISMSEVSDDVTLSSVMYSGRTGAEVSRDRFYATGNNRFSTVLRRFRNAVLDKLTVRGKIIKRNGKTLVIDLGRSENIVKGAEFKIIRNGCLKTADSGNGLFYKDEDLLGLLTVTESGEEISEAEITNHGFYDHINVDDEVVFVSQPDQNSESGMDTVPNADENGNPLVNNDVVGSQLVSEIKKAVERPALLDFLRSIY